MQHNEACAHEVFEVEVEVRLLDFEVQVLFLVVFLQIGLVVVVS